MKSWKQSKNPARSLGLPKPTPVAQSAQTLWSKFLKGIHTFCPFTVSNSCWEHAHPHPKTEVTSPFISFWSLNYSLHSPSFILSIKMYIQVHLGPGGMSVVTTTLCIQRAIHFCLVLFFFPFIHSFTYFSFIHFFYIPITASPPSSPLSPTLSLSAPSPSPPLPFCQRRRGAPMDVITPWHIKLQSD